jgi:hypothetical protein
MKDSIMNVDISDSLKVVLKSSSEDPLTVVKELCNSYCGYSAMINIVLDLLQFSTSLTSCSSKCEGSNSHITNLEKEISFDKEQILTEKLAIVLKNQFTTDQADALVARLTHLPHWLELLIDDPIFRKTLIELYDQHKDSALLGFCLRQISSKGHHRCVVLSLLISHNIYFEKQLNKQRNC